MKWVTNWHPGTGMTDYRSVYGMVIGPPAGQQPYAKTVAELEQAGYVGVYEPDVAPAPAEPAYVPAPGEQYIRDFNEPVRIRFREFL